MILKYNILSLRNPVKPTPRSLKAFSAIGPVPDKKNRRQPEGISMSNYEYSPFSSPPSPRKSRTSVT